MSNCILLDHELHIILLTCAGSDYRSVHGTVVCCRVVLRLCSEFNGFSDCCLSGFPFTLFFSAFPFVSCGFVDPFLQYMTHSEGDGDKDEECDFKIDATGCASGDMSRLNYTHADVGKA